jgi:hypothetical protein
MYIKYNVKKLSYKMACKFVKTSWKTNPVRFRISYTDTFVHLYFYRHQTVETESFYKGY